MAQVSIEISGETFTLGIHFFTQQCMAINKHNLINRELSWLNFNSRVMQEAIDESVPLVQRLRFLGIFSNNLDEFFKVRVASLKRLLENPSKEDKIVAGGFTNEELLGKISQKVDEFYKQYFSVYDTIMGELAKQGIKVINEKELNEEQIIYLRKYFLESVSSQIVPLMLSKGREKMPFLADDNIYLAVEMIRGEKSTYSILELPVNKSIPRFIVLPSPAGETNVIYLDDVIRLNLDEIFFMFDFTEIRAYTFKLTRDAEMTLDDDISKSNLERMEESLSERSKGQPVRFVYDRTMPEKLLNLLLKKLGLKHSENISPSGRYHQMRDLMKFPKISKAFEYTTPHPVHHHKLKPFHSIIDVVRKKDVLLAFPYHSFNHLIDFLREAAIDSKVEEIYVTLYRVADRSKIVNALVNAAKNNKKVVVLVELLARFDEENNIRWTEVLQEAGIKVINGVDGLKVHSKLILVRRREGNVLSGYTFIGTGNLNESTANIYTDLGLLTHHQGIADDALHLFDFLQKNHRRFDPKYLLISPYSMRASFERMIDREIANAKKGKEAFIYLKLNSFVDEEMIELLYKASRAGVIIKLIVRGACCIKIGEEGVSDKIAGISIVDMYLEHSRIAIFCSGGANDTFIMSADWMVRNFDRRVEVGVQIYDQKIRCVLMDLFNIEWRDNVKARDLASGDKNTYVRNGLPECRSQIALYEYFASLREE